MQHTRVKDLQHLKTVCQDKSQLDCFILLKEGLRSSKTLLIYDSKKGFEIFNDVDGTIDEFNSWEEVKDTFIGEAIEKGGFYIFDYERVEMKTTQ